jgi:DNA-directed RNA polymerase sigma subunit (sigma70/sigma32)
MESLEEKFENVIEDYYKIYGRKPNNDEIAARLGLSLSQVKNIQKKIALNNINDIGYFGLNAVDSLDDDEVDMNFEDIIEDKTFENADEEWKYKLNMLERKSRLWDVLDTLPKIEKKYLELRFGLFGQKAYTVEQIAKNSNMTIEEVISVSRREFTRILVMSMRNQKLFKFILGKQDTYNED